VRAWPLPIWRLRLSTPSWPVSVPAHWRRIAASWVSVVFAFAETPLGCLDLPWPFSELELEVASLCAWMRWSPLSRPRAPIEKRAFSMLPTGAPSHLLCHSSRCCRGFSLREVLVGLRGRYWRPVGGRNRWHPRGL
jgi:hypothetical protein